MIQTNATMITELATMASKFQHQLTGHSPAAVTVVLSEETLVVTLHEALTPAEKALARSIVGAAQVQEFHRQLFSSASYELRREIRRITGREVREAAAEIEPASGAVVHAFTTGTMVQVFSLTKRGKEVGEAEPELDRWANETGQELLRQPQKDGQKS